MDKRILIVEDDPDIARLIQIQLGDLHCTTEIAGDGRRGLARALSGDFDLMVLDVMLPELDGLGVLRELRGKDPGLPVLMLTSKSSELDRVLGLEIGADDYLTKPFSTLELSARVKALLRRAELCRQTETNPEERHRIGDLAIDVERREVQLDGEPVSLTAREFDLLLHFARHPGRVFSRAQLLDQVWGYGHDGYEHTVNSHINRLRAKIEQSPSEPRYIITIWGVGYRMAEAA